MDIVTVGITGASGGAIAMRLLDYLSQLELELHLVATEHGRAVFAYETGADFDRFTNTLAERSARVLVHRNDDMFAPIASGSYGVRCMAVVPCSVATAGKLANGCGDNLLTRAADVCLKERARLVLAVRESPLHAVHLRNLLALSELGAQILPPVPSFYDRRETWDGMLNGITGRILKAMGFENDLYHKWKETSF